MDDVNFLQRKAQKNQSEKKKRGRNFLVSLQVGFLLSSREELCTSLNRNVITSATLSIFQAKYRMEESIPFAFNNSNSKEWILLRNFLSLVSDWDNTKAIYGSNFYI